MRRALHRRAHIRWRHRRLLCASRQPTGAGWRRMLDSGGDFMAKTFGFDEDELKMLLVAVRQRRPPSPPAPKPPPAPQAAVDAFPRLYDDLYEKLLTMAGPLPES